jgi:hypothetical protein
MAYRSGPRWRSVAGAALVVAPALALAACSVQSTGYARAACGDLSALLQSESRGYADAELAVVSAAARADRAADTDGSFKSFYSNLREVREALATGPGWDRASLREATEALTAVGVVCADLGAPVESVGTPLSAMTLQDLTHS